MNEKQVSPVRSGGLRILKIVLTALLALVLVCVIAVFAVWHNELFTLMSIKQLNGPDDANQDGAVYEMTVSGGYYFDEFLEQGGASTDSELIAYITQHITA